VISALRQLLLKFFALFRHNSLDRDHDCEVSSHLELAIEENLRHGMSPEEARRHALIQLGGLQQTKEHHRESRSLALLEVLFRDLVFGARMLRKNPGFTFISILALALGIGVSAIVFSIFYNGILNPFPYRNANRLLNIHVDDVHDLAHRQRPVFHLDEIATLRKQNHTLEDIAGFISWDVLYNKSGVTQEIHGVVMTPNSMQFFGVQPMLGRSFSEQDAQIDSPPVIILGYLYWQKELQSDKSIVGKPMMIDNQPRTVIGVMPPRFYLFGGDFYTPLAWNRIEPLEADAMVNNIPFYFFTLALPKRGVNAKTVAADLQPIVERLAPLHKDDYPEKFLVGTTGFTDAIIGDFRKTMYLLIGSVVLLLFISSSNVASLLLVHTSARAKEISLRIALGAGRRRLIRQLLIESCLLGALGCVAGCLVAYWSLISLQYASGMNIPGEADITLNWQVLLFAVAISFITVLLFGMSPAFYAVRKDLRVSLQGSSVNSREAQHAGRLRSGLVIGQVALSMLLLVFAGLVIRSFIAITHFDPGISTKNMFVGHIHFPGHQYDAVETKRAFFENAISRISAIPGVENVATAITAPLNGAPTSNDVTIPGKPHSDKWTTAFEACSESYFRTLGVRLLRGRLLSASDISSARRVAVINQTLAAKYFQNEDSLGHQIKFNELDQIPTAPHDAYFEIIGIVSDFSNYGLEEKVVPEAFVPYTFSSFDDRTILVRTSIPPGPLTNTFRQVLHDVDPNPILSRPETLEAMLQLRAYARPQFRILSFGACAAIGLGLALIGLFGVMAYTVALQTHSLCIRMALGAQRDTILLLVLRKGFFLVGSGVLLGLFVAFLSVRLVQSQLWGVSAFDPLTLVLAPIALLAAGLLACYIPARRATRVDPMIALRYE
jgi:predicted permease